MKILLCILSLLASVLPALAVSWTNAFVQPTGDNLNSGIPAAVDTDAILGGADNAANFTYAGGTFVRSTRVFTVASGNPAGDGVVVGDFASIYTTAGATVATYIGRITARDATTITIDATAIMGAATTVDETAAAATCKIGGAWAGMSGSTIFPFGSAIGTLQNSSGNKLRVWIKGDGNFATADYTVSASLTANKAGVIIWSGYTTVPGDHGIANISGGTSGTYYRLVDVTGALNGFENFDFSNHGNTGSPQDLFYINVAETYCRNVSWRNARRAGVSILSRSNLYGCWATACNTGNISAYGAIDLRADGSLAHRCVSFANTAGANCHGITGGGNFVVECILSGNAGSGYFETANKITTILQSDFNGNGGDGIRFSGTATTVAVLENNNFVNNRGYGVNFNGVDMTGVMYNCGFGAGTMDNDSGQYSTQNGVDIKGLVTYPSNVTPWRDPANGDFRIVHPAAKGTGRGTFSTFNGASNPTIGFPDIGSGQHFSTAGQNFFQFFGK